MTNDSGPQPPWPSPPAPPAVDLEHAPEHPTPEHRRPGWLRWVAVGAVVILAVAAFFVTKSLAEGGSGSPAAASTSPTEGPGNGSANGQSRTVPGAAGQITAINGTTLTVQGRQNQSVTVITTSSTRISVAKTVPLSMIANGDRITVTGQQSGTTIAASRIMVADASTNGTNAQRPSGSAPGSGAGPEGGFRRGATNGNGANGANRQAPSGFAFGTVTKVSGNTITISSFNGSTMTVTTSSTTTVTKTEPGTFTDLKVGQTIRATGSTSSNGTVTATAITEGAGGFGFGGFRGQGAP